TAELPRTVRTLAVPGVSPRSRPSEPSAVPTGVQLSSHRSLIHDALPPPLAACPGFPAVRGPPPSPSAPYALDASEPDALASPRAKSRPIPGHRVSRPSSREQGERSRRTALVRLLSRLLVSEAGAQYVPLGLPALPPQPRA